MNSGILYDGISHVNLGWEIQILTHLRPFHFLRPTENMGSNFVPRPIETQMGDQRGS